MACLGALTMSSSSAASSAPRRRRCQASLRTPTNSARKSVYLPQSLINMEALVHREEEKASTSNRPTAVASERSAAKLRAIAQEVADRAEMHSIIGEQRSNWNALLLDSINSITLTASLMAGMSAVDYSLPLKVASVVLFTSATGMMVAVNKVQPSQLAEEQRNAARKFKQIERSIRTTLAIGTLSESDVEEALERVLALEKAYPLPLLPLPDKFPKVVQPSRWWPKLRPKKQQQKTSIDGWSREMEEEMMGILRVLKTKDEEQYVTCGELVSKINKNLAVLGPVLAATAAVGTALVGSSSSSHEPWPALVGVVGGALATVVNTLEHGGQMGMVFEIFRNCAGYYRHLEEEIEMNLSEGDAERREDAELFEMKMALHLGRSLSELRGFASYASASCKDEDIKEFAGKLF